MDLIYADGQLNDLGVLKDYSFDMEYGKNSSNDFECKVQKYNHVCDQDYILYVEYTEYGGVIDRIESDTKTGVVSYKGRTWHGLLNSFVIEPPEGQMYRTYNGDANDVLREIVNLCGLSDLFDVAYDESGVTINAFQSRYENAYDLILRMMDEYNAKMYCYWQSGKVHIGCMLAMNYAVSEEFDSSQVPFKVGLTFNNYNHLVCLGQGQGKNRAVIHLFCDEGGGVQPYALIDNPLQDSDYILDKRNQVLFGREERAVIYDAPNAEIITNYILLTEKPSDWNGSYFHYYTEGVNPDTDELDYKNIERVYEDEYHLQYVEPNDWRVQNGYQKYYYWDGNTFANVNALSEEQATITYAVLTQKPVDWDNYYDAYYELDSASQSYRRVSANTNDIYTKVDKAPADWKWHYSSYYSRTWNGTAWVYSAVRGNESYKYTKHSKKPADWEKSWGNYYTKLPAGSYKKGKHIIKYKAGYYTVNYAVNTAKVIAKQKGKTYPKWVKGKFYNRETIYYAPKFDSIKNGVFSKTTQKVTPTFESGRYYIRYVNDMPTWTKGTYYTLIKDVEQIPEFVSGKYFYGVEDRYAMLIQNAMKKWAEIRDTSTLNIDLELESNYDVGDVIGSIDEVTKVEVNKPILRKVIRIRKDIVSVEHSVD
jgi:hypothetical protein